MKKKVLAVIAAMTLTFGLSVTAFAGGVDEKTPSPNSQKGPGTTAPGTGESAAVYYGITAAALLAGTAVISRKKLEEAK